MHGRFYTPDITGLWYSACRLMENTATRRGDRGTARQARALTEAIEASYLEYFYDPAVGALATSWDPATRRRNTSFQNVATFGLEGPFGHLLVQPVVERLAHFLTHTLRHPKHRTAVPHWDKAREMWKDCIMLFHAYHEGRILKRGGASRALAHTIDLLIELFETHGIAMETLNLVPCPNNIGQDMKTQAMSLYVFWKALIHAIFGLTVDRGGLTYEPGDFPEEAALTGWTVGGRTWDIEVTGRGEWLRRMEIDGRRVAGTFKVPAVGPARHRLRLTRSETPPRFGTILTAIDGQVLSAEPKRNALRAMLSGWGRVTVEFYADARPEATWLGEPLPAAWDDQRARARVDCPIEGKGELLITQARTRS